MRPHLNPCTMFAEDRSSTFQLGIVREWRELIFVAVFEERDLLPGYAILELRPRFLSSTKEKAENYPFNVQSEPQVESHCAHGTDSRILMTKGRSVLHLIQHLSLFTKSAGISNRWYKPFL